MDESSSKRQPLGKFEFTNYDFLKDNSETRDYLPNPIRALFYGSSNSGKTNALLNILLDEKGLRFNRLYLISKSCHQQKYALLKEIMADLPEIEFDCFETEQDFPPDMKFESCLIIFDDLDYRTKTFSSLLRNSFTRGRHFEISAIVLAQNPALLPAHEIRENANVFVCFPIGLRALTIVYKDAASNDMNFGQFVNLARKCWKQKFDFLYIDLSRSCENGRYRKNLDFYWAPKDYLV